MASGGPGDDWLTDLMNWQLPAFGQPQDDLIRSIVELGGVRTLELPPWGDTLTQLWSRRRRWRRSRGERERLAALVAPLTDLRDRLHAEALDRGWEVD